MYFVNICRDEKCERDYRYNKSGTIIKKLTASSNTFCATRKKVEDCNGPPTKERQPRGLPIKDFAQRAIFPRPSPWKQAFRSSVGECEPWTVRLYSFQRKRALRSWCYALILALPSRWGAICTRLTCASTDSLAFDYVASGSNRAVSDSRPSDAPTTKRGNRKGCPSRILPKGQYSHDLCLESKLSDLRSGNANLLRFTQQGRGLQWFHQQKRDNREGCLSFVGGPSRTRTLDRPVMSREL